MNAAGMPLLSIVTFLPLFGALWIMFLKDDESGRRNARRIALLRDVGTFGVALYLWLVFDPSTPEFQFVEEAAWLGPVNYKHGRRRHLDACSWS